MEAQPPVKKNILEIIKSNLKVIIIILSLLLAVLIAFSWMKYTSDTKKTKLSESFVDAKILLSQKKPGQALEVLKEIIEKKDSTYSVLSLYLVIDQDLLNDNKEILRYFDEVLSINTLTNEDHNLIKLKKAIFLSSEANEDDLLEILNPIINSESIWKAQSIKLLADYYFYFKEYNKANQYYSKLLTLDNTNIDMKEIRNKIKASKK